MRHRLLAPLLACLATTLATPARAEGASGTEHLFEFAKSGHTVISEQEIRLPGTAEPHLVVVERSDDGIGLSLWQSWAPGRYRLRWRSEKSPGDEALPLAEIAVGSRRALRLDVFEDSPDEELHRVRLFLLEATGSREIFAGEYRVVHSEEDAGRVPRPELRLGPSRPGLSVAEGVEGMPALTLRTEEKRVLLLGKTGPTAAIIGARETSYRYHEQTYRLASTREANFLCPVAATPQGPPETAAASDGDVGTEWTFAPPSEKEKPTLSLRLPEGSAVRALRIVPGCAADEARWRKHGRLIRLSLRLDDKTTLAIDRHGSPEGEVFGSADFALPGKSFALQTLVVLSRRIPAQRLTLTVEALEPGADPAAGGCLAEVTVLDAPSSPDEGR
ncbi:MAG: hypothetical protein GYA21_13480 [Myxococcales bacterium]|nr:hypothetical protein [Myxococcales bacterium]